MHDPQEMDHTPEHHPAQVFFWESFERVYLMVDVMWHVADRVHLFMEGNLPTHIGLHDLAEVDRGERGDSVSWRLGVDEAQTDAVESHVGQCWVAVDEAVLPLRIDPVRNVESETNVEFLVANNRIVAIGRRTRPDLLVKGLDGQEQEVVFRHMGKVFHDESAGAVWILPEHVDLRRDVLAKVVHVDCLGLELLERTVLDHSREDFRPAMT